MGETGSWRGHNFMTPVFERRAKVSFLFMLSLVVVETRPNIHDLSGVTDALL